MKKNKLMLILATISMVITFIIHTLHRFELIDMINHHGAGPVEFRVIINSFP